MIPTVKTTVIHGGSTVHIKCDEGTVISIRQKNDLQRLRFMMSIQDSIEKESVKEDGSLREMMEELFKRFPLKEWKGDEGRLYELWLGICIKHVTPNFVHYRTKKAFINQEIASLADHKKIIDLKAKVESLQKEIEGLVQVNHLLQEANKNFKIQQNQLLST